MRALDLDGRRRRPRDPTELPLDDESNRLRHAAASRRRRRACGERSRPGRRSGCVDQIGANLVSSGCNPQLVGRSRRCGVGAALVFDRALDLRDRGTRQSWRDRHRDMGKHRGEQGRSKGRSDGGVRQHRSGRPLCTKGGGAIACRVAPRASPVMSASREGPGRFARWTQSCNVAYPDRDARPGRQDWVCLGAGPGDDVVRIIEVFGRFRAAWMPLPTWSTVVNLKWWRSCPTRLPFAVAMALSIRWKNATTATASGVRRL